MTNAERYDRLMAAGRGGQFFTVTFIKRSTKELRTMNCRLGVTKHLKGGTKAYNDADHGLLTVFEMNSKGYRSIPVDAVKSINGEDVS